jgi:hypothetical protein
VSPADIATFKSDDDVLQYLEELGQNHEKYVASVEKELDFHIRQMKESDNKALEDMKAFKSRALYVRKRMIHYHGTLVKIFSQHMNEANKFMMSMLAKHLPVFIRLGLIDPKNAAMFKSRLASNPHDTLDNMDLLKLLFQAYADSCAGALKIYATSQIAIAPEALHDKLVAAALSSSNTQRDFEAKTAFYNRLQILMNNVTERAMRADVVHLHVRYM